MRYHCRSFATIATMAVLASPAFAQTSLRIEPFSGLGESVGAFVTNGAQSDGYSRSGSIDFITGAVAVPGARAGVEIKAGQNRSESRIFTEHGSVDATASAGSEAGTISRYLSRQQNRHKIVCGIFNDNGQPRRELLRDLVVTIDGTQTGSGFVEIEVDVDNNGTVDLTYRGNQPTLKGTFFEFGRFRRPVTFTINAGAVRTAAGGGSYDLTIKAELVKPPISPVYVSRLISKGCSAGEILAYDTPTRTEHRIDLNIYAYRPYPTAFLAIGRQLPKPLSAFSCSLYVDPDVILPVHLDVAGSRRVNLRVPSALNFVTYAEFVAVDWRGGYSVSPLYQVWFDD